MPGRSFPGLVLTLAVLQYVAAFQITSPGLSTARAGRAASSPPLGCWRMRTVQRPAYAPMQTAKDSSQNLWGLDFMRVFGFASPDVEPPIRPPRPPRAGDSIAYRTLVQPPEDVLKEAAVLCTTSIFGSEDGWRLTWETFENKYIGSDRKSVLVVAEVGDQVVGCCGMEMMLVNEQGLAWWRDPSADFRLRPFVSDLAVASGWRRRGVGRRLLEEVHAIAAGAWSDELAAATAAERQEASTEQVYLKVDSDNLSALRLYQNAGYAPCP